MFAFREFASTIRHNVKLKFDPFYSPTKTTMSGSESAPFQWRGIPGELTCRRLGIISMFMFRSTRKPCLMPQMMTCEAKVAQRSLDRREAELPLLRM